MEAIQLEESTNRQSCLAQPIDDCSKKPSSKILLENALIQTETLDCNSQISSTQANNLMQLHFERFISEVKSNVNKCKYRKALEDIREKATVFTQIKDYWLIFELKLKCLRKVIDRKLSKPNKIKNMETWMMRFDTTLDEWFAYILEKTKTGNETQDTINIHVEMLIKNILYQCYNYALLAKEEKQIADSIGFLTLGERLIKFIIDFTNLPDTMNIIQKILLFMSSILIADNDFETAKKYQANSLKISLRELYQRVDYEEGINKEKMNKYELHALKKCMMNIAIAFFQKGACEESLGSILKAIESYKQARWFAVNFLKSTDPDLVQFIEDVEIRSLNYNNLLNNIKNNASNVLSQNVKPKKFKSSLFHKEEENVKKYENQMERIKGMVFNEVEDNDILVKKSDSITFVMSTIKTVNNLLSSKFRNMIKGIDERELNVCKLSKDLKNKIQRKINEVKAEKLYEENKRRCSSINPSMIKSINKREVENDTNLIGDFCQVSDRSLESQIVKPKAIDFDNCTESKKETRPATSIRPKSSNKGYPLNQSNVIQTSKLDKLMLEKLKSHDEKQNSRIERNHLQKSATVKNPYSNNLQSSARLSQSSKKHPSFFPQEEKIKKYEFSNYISNKSYQTKVSYLNSVNLKELDFQKKLLKSKRNEKIVIDKLDLKKVNESCQQFFQKIYVNTKKTFIEDERLHKKKEMMLEEKKKTEKAQSELTRKVLKSGDYKMLKQLNQMMNSTPTHKPKKQNQIETEGSNGPISVDGVSKNILQKENMIVHQINTLESNEQQLSKIINPGIKNSKKQKHLNKTLKDFMNSKVNNFIQASSFNPLQEDSI